MIRKHALYHRNIVIRIGQELEELQKEIDACPRWRKKRARTLVERRTELRVLQMEHQDLMFRARSRR